MDDLENASDLPAFGSKMGIDATRKWPSEGFTREWPTRVVTSEARRAPRGGDLGAGGRDGRAGRRKGLAVMARRLEDLVARLAAGEALAGAEAADLAATTDILTLGMLADEARRRRHGPDTTYVRVADVTTADRRRRARHSAPRRARFA